MISKAITKTVSINAPLNKVFTFLVDATNWPKWAVVNVKSIEEGDGEWFRMQTAFGWGKLRIRANREHGILDHDFDSPEAAWTVPARVVANGDGSEFMITFYKPPPFSDEFFAEQVAVVDEELEVLKRLMESQ